jgi:SAM-dependent methyltransferase
MLCRQRSKKGTFLCQDASELAVQEPHSFDIVMANGLLHHLTDEQAEKTFEIAAKALKPNGYLVTFDGCILKGQSPIARLLLHLDRGKFVRTQKGYEELAKKYFATVSSYIRHDMYSIPYTIIIMQCQGSLVSLEPAAASSGATRA